MIEPLTAVFLVAAALLVAIGLVLHFVVFKKKNEVPVLVLETHEEPVLVVKTKVEVEKPVVEEPVVEDPVVESVAKEVDEETAIQNAIAALDPKNAEHWAYFGQSRQRPSIDAIEEILGYHPDFHVLLEVWHKIQEEKE
jgi:hypothetical protein